MNSLLFWLPSPGPRESLPKFKLSDGLPGLFVPETLGIDELASSELPISLSKFNAGNPFFACVLV